MFEKLDELNVKVQDLQEEIDSEKLRLVSVKMKELGLEIGDIISNGRTKGFLTYVYLSHKSFRFNAVAIKKDGTASKNSAGMWCSLDEVSKVEL